MPVESGEKGDLEYENVRSFIYFFPPRKIRGREMATAKEGSESDKNLCLGK